MTSPGNHSSSKREAQVLLDALEDFIHVAMHKHAQGVDKKLELTGNFWHSQRWQKVLHFLRVKGCWLTVVRHQVVFALIKYSTKKQESHEKLDSLGSSELLNRQGSLESRPPDNASLNGDSPDEERASATDQSAVPRLPQKLMDGLQERVFNQIPIRLLAAGSEIKLLDRNGVFQHIALKMSRIDQKAFEEMGGAGYKKLIGFCEVARESGISLAWMDTICINKDSSSELDESIRSMYRWYERSSICITYLADTASLDDMACDRWFTRGWTLQELLALARRTKFYNQNWTRLNSGENDKESTELLQVVIVRGLKTRRGFGYALQNIKYPWVFRNPYPNPSKPLPLVEGKGLCGVTPDNHYLQVIEAATGITPQELSNFTPGVGNGSTGGLARRMVCAANRTTTRGEDTAYALMGIFCVSFSIAYGEGADRAFFRLIEAIVTTFEEVSDILNWSLAGRPISPNIHASRPIPSSPRCHRQHVYAENWPSMKDWKSKVLPVESMALTQHRLRVRFLLVSVWSDRLDTPRFPGAGRHRNFDVETILSNDAGDSYPRCLLGGPDANSLLGVWNFVEEQDDVVIPEICLAIPFELQLPQ
ncbi:hypothetical protein BDZ97DRAFT_2035612 [Flammula alnicola]|nr:hypothetical protein BDZ97DRAFT_2035612 [Flammula alnicola]